MITAADSKIKIIYLPEGATSEFFRSNNSIIRPSHYKEKTEEEKAIIREKNLSKSPKTFEALYTQWDKKIRTTVQNRVKIALDEVEDVVQVIYTAAYQNEWVNIYDGNYAFSTFIYTYVRKEIQNYINKRDSGNTVRSTGTRRYLNISAISKDERSAANFLDKLTYSRGNTLCEDALEMDLKLLYEYTHLITFDSLFHSFTYHEMIEKMVSCKEDFYTDKDGNSIQQYVPISIAQVRSDTGIEEPILLNILESLRIFITKDLDKALDFIDAQFGKV